MLFRGNDSSLYSRPTDKMMTRSIALLVLLLLYTSAFGQKDTKDWTPWAPVQGDWAEFQALVNFKDGSKTRDEIVKAKLKSLKISVLIGGRIKGTVPPEVAGVKTIRILFTEIGRFQTFQDFMVDWVEVAYSRQGLNVNPVTIVRQASQFEVDQTAEPKSEVTMSTSMPTILAPLGVEPVSTKKLSGYRYRLQSEWRRKGNTVEIKLKDYRHP